MATVNDIITIMQNNGIGAGLPRQQYLDYYNKIKEIFSNPEPHKIYVLGWGKGDRLRVPIIKLSYILEDINVELLELVIKNNNQFCSQIGLRLPQDKLAKRLNSLIAEYDAMVDGK